MAGSLLPIVLGYVVAHYATLLIVEGQRVAINSDPLGCGWNVFGSAEMGVNSAIFNHPTAIAATQACAIVGGHVFGIISAHEEAVALLPPDRALSGQLPLLLVMIGYTCAGLLLLISALRETVRAREAELITLRDEDDVEVHHMPKRVLAEHESVRVDLPAPATCGPTLRRRPWST
jgi:hypothetical protein